MSPRLMSVAFGLLVLSVSFHSPQASQQPQPRPAAPVAPCFDRTELKGARTLSITYAKDRVNAGEVLDALQREGLGIVDVSTQEPDLEDVFLSLTRSAA